MFFLLVVLGISISQLCDRRHKVLFDKDACIITSIHDGSIILRGLRHENICMIDLKNAPDNDLKCLATISDNRLVMA